MASIGPKIQLPKVALEIVLAGHALNFIQETGTREATLAAVEKVVRADFLALPDSAFRRKYVNYIRSYWGGTRSSSYKRKSS